MQWASPVWSTGFRVPLHMIRVYYTYMITCYHYIVINLYYLKKCIFYTTLLASLRYTI